MHTGLEIKAYELIDELLFEISKTNKAAAFAVYSNRSAGTLAKDILEKYELVTFTGNHKNILLAHILPAGIKVTENGGIQKFLAALSEKESEIEFASKLELQKVRLEIDDLTNRLIDYRKIKNQSLWAIIFSAVAAVAAMIALLK